jgi:hypothetical protein
LTVGFGETRAPIGRQINLRTSALATDLEIVSTWSAPMTPVPITPRRITVMLAESIRLLRIQGKNAGDKGWLQAVHLHRHHNLVHRRTDEAISLYRSRLATISNGDTDLRPIDICSCDKIEIVSEDIEDDVSDDLANFAWREPDPTSLTNLKSLSSMRPLDR